jgi:hypothetical protein
LARRTRKKSYASYKLIIVIEVYITEKEGACLTHAPVLEIKTLKVRGNLSL